MTKKAKTSKRSERGLNVKVTQEKKTAEHKSVRINRCCNEEKTTSKTTVSKKTSKEKESKVEPKVEIKKEVIEEIKEEFKVVPAKEEIKEDAKLEPKAEELKAPEVILPTEEESTKEENIEESPAKEEMVEEKPIIEENPAEEEKPIEEEVVEKKPAEEVTKEGLAENSAKDEQPADQQPTDEQTNFETLALDTTSAYTSKIVPRDVARNRADVENLVVKDFKIEPVKNSEPIRTLPRAEKKVAKSTKLSAKEIKEREIKKIVNTASRLPKTPKKSNRKFKAFGNLGWARMTLMITCVATAVFAMAYFINLTYTDMSLKKAAAESGIEATYPDYIPRGYTISDVTSASGKVTMSYKSDTGSFTISEESSNWDSNALLNNYIRSNYDDSEYSVVVEQGLTIYMGNNWEVWVNGGLLYKLDVKTGSLTKKQLKTIATSL